MPSFLKKCLISRHGLLQHFDLGSHVAARLGLCRLHGLLAVRLNLRQQLQHRYLRHQGLIEQLLVCWRVPFVYGWCWRGTRRQGRLEYGCCCWVKLVGAPIIVNNKRMRRDRTVDIQISFNISRFHLRSQGEGIKKELSQCNRRRCLLIDNGLDVF